ncbi:MAG: hypothetical protein Q7N87_01530 [Candidatus Uhrbacteria bacterium]|nr:hypothetical protein [Candidatus Uhrbacteria bacterium]
MAFHRDRDSGGKKGGRSFGGGKPMMHSATCSDCGSRCQVPFKPSGSRPVLCKNCFGNDTGRSRSETFGSNRSNHSDDRPKRFGGGETNFTDLLKEINNKLDMIIRSLND